MTAFIDKYSKTILEGMPEAVYVIDKEFKIQFVNNAALKIIGKGAKDLIGKVCRNICKSDRCEIGCPITEVLRTNRNILDLQTTFQKENGDLINIILNASLLKDIDDKTLGGIISFKESPPKGFNDHLNGENSFYGIVGISKQMKSIFQLIKEISTSYATVLISGETGVGKELIANAIQITSQRSKENFVKVNCAALPSTLLSSELFGHVKGAFTDAKKDRVGRFEYADGGTIFLDEITELPLEMQAQLLRVLQEGTFERLGDSKTIRTDIRIIAATNKDLTSEIKKGSFRKDLFYRLNVLPIEVPPLRERREDIIHLVQHFLKKYCKKYSKNIPSFDDESIEILTNYDWPGNIRELENAVEYSVIRSKRDDYLCVCCLPSNLRVEKDCGQTNSVSEKMLDEKTETLLALLRQNNWNKTKVAKILGVNRSTIHRQLNKIDPPH